MSKNFKIYREKEKEVNKNLIGDNLELFLNKMYIADVSYKYQLKTDLCNGSIIFKDKVFSIYYCNSEFSNGLINSCFIKPIHSIDGFITELTKQNLDSFNLRDRIDYLKEFLKLQDDKIHRVYREFLDIK